MPARDFARYFVIALVAGCGGVGATDEPAARIRSDGTLGDCAAMSDGSAEAKTSGRGCAVAVEPPCWLAAAGAGYSERPLPVRATRLLVWVSVVPSQLGLDGSFGLAARPVTNVGDFALALRFNVDGSITASDGEGYAAVSELSYGAETAFRVAFVVDATERTYSAFIDDGLVAENYAFRAANTGALERFAIGVSAGEGALRACDFLASE
jgi:hypothetical protein